MSDRAVGRETMSEWRARVIPDVCLLFGIVLCACAAFGFGVSPVEEEADGVYTSMSDEDFGVVHVCEYEYEFRLGSARHATYRSGSGKDVRLSACPSPYLIAGREMKAPMTVRYDVHDPDSFTALTPWSLPTARTISIAVFGVGVLLIFVGVALPLPARRSREVSAVSPAEE